jgi:hypothetical protein
VADEVQINNVGGDGIASEVTLARLVAVTEQMAKKAGIDPKDVTKKLKALSSATGDTIKISTKNRAELKKHTKEVSAATKALKFMSSAIGTGLFNSFGAITRSGTEMVKAFAAGEKSLSAFAGHLPLIGGKLSILTGLFDDSFAAFQNVAMSGASFNNSLTELRDTSARARMSLSEFTSMISANSDKLAAFGGTATQGAKMVAAMTNSNGKMREDLLNLGFTFEDINEAMLDYSYITRAGNRGKVLEGKALEAQTANAGEYAKHLNTLAKLSGAEAKATAEAVNQKMQDVAFQRKLATMGAEEQAKVKMVMQQAMAVGGKSAVDALAAQFLGMPAVTEDARMYTATMSTQMGLLTSSLATAQDESVKTDEMSAKILTGTVALMDANAESAKEFGTLLDAAAVGIGGSAATISGFFNDATIKFTDYISTTGELDRARAEQAVKDALAEGKKRDKNTETMASFTETLGTLQSAFQTQIITPLMDAVGPAFLAISDMLSGTERDDKGKEIVKYDADGEIIKKESMFAESIKTISGMITGPLTTGIAEFLDVFKTNPKKALGDLFTDLSAYLTDALADLFLGANTKIVAGPGGPQEVEIEREGGLLSGLGTTLVNGMLDGVSSMWSASSGWQKAMVIGATALFAANGLIGTAMVAGAGALWKLATKPTVPKVPVKPTTTTPRAPAGAVDKNGKKIGGQFLDKTASKAAAKKTAIRLAAQGLKFVPGIGLVVMGGMAAFDGAGGYNADPDAGFGEKMGNAGSSMLNGLTLGMLGSSPEEIAANAAEKGNTPAQPAGTQAASMLTEEQVSIMERVSAISFEEFNMSINRLNPNKLSYIADINFTAFATGLKTFSEITGLKVQFENLAIANTVDLSDFASGMKKINVAKIKNLASTNFSVFADGLKTFAEIPNLRTQFDAVNSLDTDGVISYTSAMEKLVIALNKVNDELAKDNNGYLSAGTGTNAGDMINSVGGLNNGGGAGSEQLNTIMNQVLAELRLIKGFEESTAKNTKNITSGNIAKSGASVTGN